jgi:hypothetical protein
MTKVIDILHMEVSQNLPHWLSPEARLKGRLKEIRAKNRQRYLDRLTKAYDPSEPRDEGGKWTSGGSVTNTAAFKSWFGGSKVVDDDGKPLVVYHGTTQNIEHFTREKANVEADFGAGFYFASSIHDINANYAGFGPDLTSKIEREADRIEAEADWAERGGKGVYERQQGAHEEAVEQARQKYAANQGTVLPVYLKFENPFTLGGKNESYLDYDLNYDEESDLYGEPTGTLAKFTEQLKLAASRASDANVDDLVDKIHEHGIDGGMSASKLDDLVRNDEKFNYATDDKGDLNSHEIYRQALEGVGFDGVIDHTVYTKFGGGRKIGRPMKEVDQDDTHYIAFEPTQIKSAIGNRGTFNPHNPDIGKGQKP